MNFFGCVLDLRALLCLLKRTRGRARSSATQDWTPLQRRREWFILSRGHPALISRVGTYTVQYCCENSSWAVWELSFSKQLCGSELGLWAGVREAVTVAAAGHRSDYKDRVEMGWVLPKPQTSAHSLSTAAGSALWLDEMRWRNQLQAASLSWTLTFLLKQAALFDPAYCFVFSFSSKLL